MTAFFTHALAQFDNGRLLREAREAAAISPEMMAAFLGLSRQTIDRIERNQRPLTVQQFFGWAKLTQTDPLTLFAEHYLETLDAYAVARYPLEAPRTRKRQHAPNGQRPALPRRKR